MTRYLDIRPLQEPFDLGLDGLSRSQWSFNITVIKTESTTFAAEIIGLLEGASVGTFGVDIFTSSKSVVPDGDGPYTSLLETGGTAGLRVHDQLKPKYPRPAARIVVRATDPKVAHDLCWVAYNALAGVRNATVTP